MVGTVQEHAVAANGWLIAIMALFHFTVMGMLGLAIYRVTTYRAPLHEEFIGAIPHEHELPPEPAPEREPPEAPPSP